MCADRICDLNKSEKPREKLKKIGCANLTDVELLAIILRSGGKSLSVIHLSRTLLNKFNGFGGLMKANLDELTTFNHIGLAKASSIQAMFEISKRSNNSPAEENFKINKPGDVYQYLKKDLSRQDKENLYLLSLNSRGKVIAKDLITVGTINESLISTREIFKQALARNAVSIILAHNHPSNDPSPSIEDIQVTKRVAKAGEEIGIKLIDHVVITNTNFSSIKGVIINE